MLLVCTLALGVFLTVCNSLPVAENSQAAQERYAVLKSYSLTGVKNVRWETTPMQYVDAKGNPMPSKSSGSKNADGSTVFGCSDAQGMEHPHGVEYERPNGKFKFKCDNGQEEVVACVGSDRTNKARIEVGQTLDINGYWHKCQSFPNGSVVYTQESSCSQGGKDYRVGQEVNVGFLRLECMESGYKVVGCYYNDASNNVVPMNSGDKREEGKVTHFCEEKDNTLQYYSKNNGCTKAGKEYKEDESFKQNHLNYKCANGLTDVTGCYINDTKDLNVGQDMVEKAGEGGGMVYRCYRLGGKIEYSEYACGFNGTPSCTPEPIDSGPDDIPSLARGLQSPGVGSFAVVEKGGGDVAASPSHVQLALNKQMAAHP